MVEVGSVKKLVIFCECRKWINSRDYCEIYKTNYCAKLDGNELIPISVACIY